MVSISRVGYGLRARLLETSQHLEALARRQRSSSPHPLEAQIIADLAVEGVHLTRIDRLLPSMAAAIRDAFGVADSILRERPDVLGPSALWSRRSSSTDLKADVLLTRVPILYMLGLDPSLLQLVRHYLRLPVAYHGAVMRHSYVDGAGAGPRLWHMDAEDFHVLRMVIYMNDVGPGGGPFEYIPRHLGVSYRHFASLDGPLTDERVRTIVPKEQWKQVYGPTGTVILADTARIFHHESLQTERERSVMMIGYSSRRPRGMEAAMAHFPVESVRPILSSIVPEVNFDHVFSWRKRSTTAS